MKSEALHSDPTLDPTATTEVGTLADRISEAIGKNSIREFAIKIGVSEGTLRNLIKGGEPKLDTAIRIAEEAGVSIRWLATGNGPKYPNRQLDDISQEGIVYVHQDQFNEEYFLIEGYDVVVSTGHGAFNDETGVRRRLSFRKNWLKYRGLKPENLKVVYAKGNSMEPAIHSGDSLLVDISKTTLEDGCIFVLRLGDDLYAKRLQKLFDGGIEILSDNKEYKSQIVSAGELPMLQIIGKVVWMGKNLD
ncbi:helix-turn-helix domain-containing protein [Shewanella sp. NKUCC01_JLK]|uniref:LexA family transcriptional regulator n=1 Tax=Shewanella sp. NKUCC01_JLK TaxID=2842123 RepID=UPI001C5B86F2|nr:S24 family peptidase [Shewanella sp. NKUCC01_JLK]MBW3513228.1 helix-turn-helix domain-containing protein [Shewanella sp. NKUCC01_JLK]